MSNINHVEILELAKKLVSFQSVSPDQNGSLDFLQNILEQHGFRIIRLDKNLTSNLIATIGNCGPTFAFAGHVDVVPVGDINKWQSAPFELTEKDGYLYGRGIADMKGSIAAFISATIHYLKNNPLKNYQIVLFLTSDEESSAIDGTTVIVEYLKQYGQTINYCILGEPTSINYLGDNIKVGRRGSLTGFLEVIGKQGHIAYPHLASNPIHSFAKALNELINIQWDTGNERFPPTSLQFSNLNSGLGVTNVTPNTLTASFNFRYNTLHTAHSLSQQVEAILNKHSINYKVKWTNSAKPFYTEQGRLVEAIKDVISNNLKVTPSLTTDGGTSDGRFLIDVCKEIVEFGLCNDTIHQINERVKSSDLYNLAQAYYLILCKICHD